MALVPCVRAPLPDCLRQCGRCQTTRRRQSSPRYRPLCAVLNLQANYRCSCCWPSPCARVASGCARLRRCSAAAPACAYSSGTTLSIWRGRRPSATLRQDVAKHSRVWKAATRELRLGDDSACVCIDNGAVQLPLRYPGGHRRQRLQPPCARRLCQGRVPEQAGCEARGHGCPHPLRDGVPSQLERVGGDAHHFEKGSPRAVLRRLRALTSAFFRAAAWHQPPLRVTWVPSKLRWKRL
jgi:hypothetical protein